MVTLNLKVEAVETFFVLVRLMLDGRDKRVSSTQIVDHLPSLLAERARHVHRSDSDGALEADSNYPGYLRRIISGLAIYVPFPLVRAFPPSNVLESLISTAGRITVGDKTSVCLSGSSTFLGKLGTVGDIDLCEYLFDGEIVQEGVLKHSQMLQSIEEDFVPSAILAKVKFTGQTFTHPFTLCGQELRDFVQKGPPTGLDRVRLKLDFCVVVTGIGPMPASNIVLWLQHEQPEQGNALDSFAHQEAVLDRGEGVSRTLVGSERLGAYIWFLRSEMGHYVAERPLKALKRALSLCALLSLNELFEEATTLLNEPLIQLETHRKRLDEIELLVADCDNTHRKYYMGLVLHERKKLLATCLRPDDRLAIERVVRLFVDKVSGLVDDVGRALEVADAEV